MSAGAEGVELRTAQVQDARQLAECHVTSWREAYAPLLSPGFLAAIDVDQRERMWHRRLSTPSQQVQVVAEHAGRVVGFAVAGAGPDDPPVRAWALRGLYLLAAHHGTGVGQRLLDAAVETRPCSLWVAEGNARARAFYARNGFSPDGVRTTEPEWEDLAEIRMVR